MKLLKTAHGVVLDMHVKPNSKKFRVELDGDELVVSCREAPVKGKVNRELLKQLSRLFNRKVELISGFTSRQKRFLISGIEVEEVNRILASASNTQQ
ncbi:MAG: YggU family protein [Candidatus Bathyarchaeota archaeon]